MGPSGVPLNAGMGKECWEKGTYRAGQNWTAELVLVTRFGVL